MPAVASGVQIALPFRLTGSQAKTAFALRSNIESMIAGNAKKTLREIEYPCGTGVKKTKLWIADAPENLHCIGFLTLTVGDWKGGKFVQIWDAAEASRRINNLNRRILPLIFERAVIVTERHASGAIHFHIVGILRGRPDIRTGFDFATFKEYRKNNQKFEAADVGASLELAQFWKMLREKLPEYGFGRAELTPIEKTGEAIACYVSKYIEKNICNRTADDKRKKLVRYIGFEKKQLKPNEFSWASVRATAWRMKTREACGLVNITSREQAAETFGPRWAFQVSKIWQKIDETLFPGLLCDYLEKQLIARELARIAGEKKFVALNHGTKYRFDLCGLNYERPEFVEYFLNYPERRKNSDASRLFSQN